MSSSKNLERKMRATSVDFLRPREADAEADSRDGWLHQLKMKFTSEGKKTVFVKDLHPLQRRYIPFPHV